MTLERRAGSGLSVRPIDEIIADWQQVEHGIDVVSDWLRLRFGRVYEVGDQDADFIWRVHRPSQHPFVLRMTSEALRRDIFWIEAQLKWIQTDAQTRAPVEPGYYHISTEGIITVQRE